MGLGDHESGSSVHLGGKDEVLHAHPAGVDLLQLPHHVRFHLHGRGRIVDELPCKVKRRRDAKSIHRTQAFVYLGEVPGLEEKAQGLLLYFDDQGAVVPAGHLDALLQQVSMGR